MTRTPKQANCAPGRKQHFWKDGACYYCGTDRKSFDAVRAVENERRMKADNGALTSVR